LGFSSDEWKELEPSVEQAACHQTLGGAGGAGTRDAENRSQGIHCARNKLQRARADLRVVLSESNAACAG
jgi:hypothetical protein